jgi:Divergent InlB B-repeat domain
MRRLLLGAICGVTLVLGAGIAQGAAPDPDFVFIPSPPPPPLPVVPPPIGSINGPCGLAVDSSGRFYVSDYYHDAVDLFNSSPSYVTQFTPVDPLNGLCGLALDGSDDLYVNDYHRNVAKFEQPGFVPGPVFSGDPLDEEQPTGVAASTTTGTVYVNNRDHIAAFDTLGVPIEKEGQPLKIGVGTLKDGYGLAVSQFPGTLGRLYVPDAASNTVKVYDPAVPASTPVSEIKDPSGKPFVSLRDTAIAVDHKTGEIYFADNTQPADTEKPQAIVYVYSAANTFKGRLKYRIVTALPPGIAVDNSTKSTQGRVYVTSGNTHQAGIYAYPPGSATNATLPPAFSLSLKASGEGSGQIVGSLQGVECEASCEAEVRSGAEVTLRARPDRGSAFTGWSGGCGGAGSCTVEMDEARAVSAHFVPLTGPPAPAHSSFATASEVAQKGNLRVSVSGKLSPKRLPREGTAPIAVSVGGEISTTDASLPPQLKSLRIEINRHGQLSYEGLPTCQYSAIQPGSTSRALANCRPALVGKGNFTANIVLSGQEPYPTKGRLLVFNSLKGKKPVLYGHIYSPRPFATSFVIIFEVKKLTRGPYGTSLDAPLPAAMKAWGRLTGLEMTLSRKYRHEGKQRSYLSAGCPAPKGFRGAVFPLARASFAFEGGKRLSSVLSSTCKVRG